MSYKINFNGLHCSKEDELYIKEKLEVIMKDGGRLLEKESVLINVSFKKTNFQEKDKQIECDIILNLGEKELYCKSYGINIRQSIDIAEEKMLSQIRKSKK